MRETMKSKKIYLLLILIIAVISVFLIKTYCQNNKLMIKINEYDANRFVSALDYFEDTSQLQVNMSEDDIDSEIAAINNSLTAITETIADYNYIYSKDVQEPQFLILYLTNTKSDFMGYKNGSKSPDINSLNSIKANYEKINNISSSVFNYHNGLSEDDWQSLKTTGFLKDERWIKWISEADSALSGSK